MLDFFLTLFVIYIALILTCIALEVSIMKDILKRKDKK